NTSFARIVISTAVVDDLVLYVVLAVALGLVRSDGSPSRPSCATRSRSGEPLGPRVLRDLHRYSDTRDPSGRTPDPPLCSSSPPVAARLGWRNSYSHTAAG